MTEAIVLVSFTSAIQDRHHVQHFVASMASRVYSGGEKAVLGSSSTSAKPDQHQHDETENQRGPYRYRLIYTG
jgi:hypothetical protein